MHLGNNARVTSDSAAYTKTGWNPSTFGTRCMVALMYVCNGQARKCHTVNEHLSESCTCDAAYLPVAQRPMESKALHTECRL